MGDVWIGFGKPEPPWFCRAYFEWCATQWGRNSYGSGFLPSVYQGVQCRSKGDPVLFASDPPGLPRHLRRRSLDAIQELNRLQADEFGHPETLTRMSQYELAFRMQTSVPEVMDITRESAATLSSYGAEPGAASFANNCLLARRLVEQGVRYVQLFDWGWDFHGTGPNEDIRDGLTKKCATMDRPVAALIEDLRSRGMLDETLIVLGGEFVYTFSGGAHCQRSNPGSRSFSGLLQHDAGRWWYPGWDHPWRFG